MHNLRKKESGILKRPFFKFQHFQVNLLHLITFSIEKIKDQFLNCKSETKKIKSESFLMQWTSYYCDFMDGCEIAFIY